MICLKLVAVRVPLPAVLEVDGLAAAVLADSAVPLGGPEAAVVHDVHQQMRRAVLVSQPLRVGVSKRVEQHSPAVIGRAVGVEQLWQRRIHSRSPSATR